MLVFTLVTSQKFNSNNYVTSLIDINESSNHGLIGPVHTNRDSFETTYLHTPNLCGQDLKPL